MALLEEDLLPVENIKPAPLGDITYEQFLEWADEDTYAEWVEGKIEFMSPASLAHQDLSGFLSAIMRVHTEDHNAGKILVAPFQMKLANILRGREPDILFVSQEHLNRFQKNYLDGPADLVVEIVSPESVLRDRGAKYGEYEAAGVQEYWIIDPMTQRGDFFILDHEGRYQRAAPDENGIYRCAVIQDFWIDLRWLWQNPLPSVREISQEWETKQS